MSATTGQYGMRVRRNAPVLLTRKDGNQWGKPVYLPKGDETILGLRKQPPLKRLFTQSF